MTHLTRLIKKRRMALEISQGNIAKELGFHPQFISNVERGLCEYPPKHFKQISKILHVDVELLHECSCIDYSINLWKEIRGK